MEDFESRDHESFREILDRKSSQYPKLLLWAEPDGQNAKIQPSLISVSGMIADYFEFARNHTLPLTGHEQDLDRQILPLLFVYRHATELALKYATAQLIRHIQRRDAEFTDAVPERHNLGRLLDKSRSLYDGARGYLNEIGQVNFISSQAQAFIRELDMLDPKGEAFRYAHRKRDKITGASEPQIGRGVDVSVEALRAGMLHIEKELLWLIDMVEITTDLYDQGTADMLADSGW